MPLGAFRVNSISRFVGPTRTAVTITANGDAQVDTASKVLGTGSALFDGTGDFLAVENTSALDLSTESFTVEFFWRAADVTTNPIVPFYWQNGYLFYIGQSGGNQVYAVFQGGNNRVLSSGLSLSNNTWYHAAFTRTYGGNWKIYHAGTEVADSAWANAPNSGTDNKIGQYSNTGYYLNGQIDEFRISDNVRYTSGFTPTTSEFSNDANTRLLLHMNGADGSTTFEDDIG